MKPFAILILGVIVGWAASGVDWSREAIGQTARFVPLGAKPDAPATLEAEISDAQTPQLSRSVPYLEREGNAVYAPVRQGSSLDFTPQQTVVQHNLVGRFQATAYGSPNGHGCYIVDSMTGKTWHLLNGHPPLVVTEALIQPATTQNPSAIPNQPPAGMSFAPAPSYYDDPSPPQRSNVVPTPKPELAEPSPDSAD